MKGARATTVRRRIIEGIVVGLVAFVAGVLGVGSFSLPPAIVATVAGGFAGVMLLEKFASPKAN